MSQDHLEEHWRAILEYAAGERHRKELAELVLKVNQILDAIEQRIAMLDVTPKQ